ncbi:hypothetical protein GCM10011613_15520 [Cellvibrio zantedeschiae]|uniref:Preprotein translocase subunit YajC n=1 Tax=Cellvibrio zantedeschiae TaxID=1237077 RepID=A0ABQ3B2R0_9GAMM|nr:hypothetical protein [Cellvibrio zantedeschiae]GGY71600.1 hypothetical protein GCM10011613_15520 [Cellvibrio zantedeschiae]
MNIGLIIILVVVVAVILGPIRMMQPTAAQKTREKMRLMARARGAHYSMRNIPQQADEQEKPAAMPVYFLPPAETQTEKGWMLVRANYQHEINLLGWWAWQGAARASDAELKVLHTYLPALPESVRALSAGSEGIYVFWNERGGEPVLEQVLQLLESLKQAAEKKT